MSKSILAVCLYLCASSKGMIYGCGYEWWPTTSVIGMRHKFSVRAYKTKSMHVVFLCIVIYFENSTKFRTESFHLGFLKIGKIFQLCQEQNELSNCSSFLSFWHITKSLLTSLLLPFSFRSFLLTGSLSFFSHDSAALFFSQTFASNSTWDDFSTVPSSLLYLFIHAKTRKHRLTNITL